MNTKRFLVFAGKVTAVHVLSYLVVGAFAYNLLTKAFYVGANPIFATFMRTEENPLLWRHAMAWQIPAQILRGLLIAIALYPFYDTLMGWTYQKRFLSIAAIYILIGCWASAAPAPGTIEGMVYLRPEITAAVHLAVQPEIIGQGLALGAAVAWWMARSLRHQRRAVLRHDAIGVRKE
jgi:hypothetical protein